MAMFTTVELGRLITPSSPQQPQLRKQTLTDSSTLLTDKKVTAVYSNKTLVVTVTNNANIEGLENLNIEAPFDMSKKDKKDDAIVFCIEQTSHDQIQREQVVKNALLPDIKDSCLEEKKKEYSHSFWSNFLIGPLLSIFDAFIEKKATKKAEKAWKKTWPSILSRYELIISQKKEEAKKNQIDAEMLINAEKAAKTESKNDENGIITRGARWYLETNTYHSSATQEWIEALEKLTNKDSEVTQLLNELKVILPKPEKPMTEEQQIAYKRDLDQQLEAIVLEREQKAHEEQIAFLDSILANLQQEIEDNNIAVTPEKNKSVESELWIENRQEAIYKKIDDDKKLEEEARQKTEKAMHLATEQEQRHKAEIQVDAIADIMLQKNEKNELYEAAVERRKNAPEGGVTRSPAKTPAKPSAVELSRLNTKFF